MGLPSSFASLSMVNATRPPLHHHDMQEKTILAFRRIVLFFQSEILFLANTHRRCGKTHSGTL
jgi:hypothetical protein